MNSVTARTIDSLNERGFDQSYPVKGGYVRPKCSQCETLVINGVACHETGCPNIVRERRGDDDE